MCVRVFSVGFGPGLDSMSPARSRRSASHAAGTHGWLPKKTWRPGLRRGGVGGYNLHSVPPDSPPDCGTPTTSRLYLFGVGSVVPLDFHQSFGLFVPYMKYSTSCQDSLEDCLFCSNVRVHPVFPPLVSSGR